jgi:cytochrome c-type biogenesis protein CcmH/NrfF
MACQGQNWPRISRYVTASYSRYSSYNPHLTIRYIFAFTGPTTVQITIESAG